MAINIFDVQNDAPKVTYDVVGRFRAGHTINKRPQSLQEWRVTSDDKAVLETIAKQFGGTVQEWDNEKQPFEVFTDATAVNVVVEKIFSAMTLWGRNGVIRKCDGQTISYPEEQAGQPCPTCSTAPDLATRKQMAQQGTGCQPDVTIRFRLKDFEDLGVFEFKSGSWNLAQDIGRSESALEKFGGKAVGTLALEPVEWVQKSTGQTRRFVKSVLNLTGPADKE